MRGGIQVAAAAIWLCLLSLSTCSPPQQRPLNGASRFPSLIDATIEQLAGALDKGLFTSETLTKVHFYPS